jgi:hypothetical protein
VRVFTILFFFFLFGIVLAILFWDSAECNLLLVWGSELLVGRVMREVGRLICFWLGLSFLLRRRIEGRQWGCLLLCRRWREILCACMFSPVN